MQAAPELLGAPTISGGSAWPGDGGGESHKSQISLPSRPKYTKTAKKQVVSRTFWLINCQKRRFSLNPLDAKRSFSTAHFRRFFIATVL